MLKSIRGATTVENNNKTEILEATKELIRQVLSLNQLDPDQIISITFTCTKDLDQVYPAVAARELGIVDAALMCMTELYVVGSLPMCIRIKMDIETNMQQRELKHIYLKNAKSLRPDITASTRTATKTFQIAIDGPSGVGKSTVAKLCAEKLGFFYVDTGAMYRALAYYCMAKGIDTDNETEVLKIVDTAPIEVKFIDCVQTIYVEGKPISNELRTQEVVFVTAKIAVINAVRKKLVAMQRELAKNASVIMDGRDIGTVVLKDSPLKIYLDASAEIRTKRRVLELERLGHSPDYGIVLKEVQDRDYKDMNRDLDPLKKAEDAVKIMCDNMDADEVCAVICALAKERMKHVNNI